MKGTLSSKFINLLKQLQSFQYAEEQCEYINQAHSSLHQTSQTFTNAKSPIDRTRNYFFRATNAWLFLSNLQRTFIMH